MADGFFGSAIIVDTSESMARDFSPGYSRLEFAKDALLEQASTIEDRAPVALFRFNGERVQKLLDAKVHRKGEFKEAVSRIRVAEGRTPLAQSIIEASDELERNRFEHGSIVAFTDGKHNAPTQAETMAQAFATVARRRNSQLFLLGLATFSSETLREYNALSSISGGGIFPLERMGVSDALAEVRRVFGFSRSVTEDDPFIQQALRLNRLLVDQRSAFLASVEKVAMERGLLEEEVKTLRANLDRLAGAPAEIAKLAAELKALKDAPTERKLILNTPFGISVAGALTLLFALLVMQTIRLQNADESLARQLGGDLKTVTTTVEKLWDIWGK